MNRQRLAILGSTGSIGCSALDVIRSYPQHFDLALLAAGANHKLLAEQVREFKPRYVYLDSPRARDEFKASALNVTIIDSEESLLQLLGSLELDSVLAAIVGSAGLKSCAAALASGKRVLLANKESLVVAGELMTSLAREKGGSIIPVDSEHSAVFQLLKAAKSGSLERIILTASGGPFLRMELSELKHVTPEQAVKHPRWSMGRKISVDLATLVNKALELIEARWLFDVEPDHIEILIHPQSIVHSLIALKDGSQLAQLSHPDMRGAIAYALGYPDRCFANIMPKLDLAQVGSLHFEGLNSDRFKAPDLARQALKAGASASLVFNLANEIAVEAFLSGRLSFDRIVPFIEESLAKEDLVALGSFNGLFAYQGELRTRIIGRL